MSYISSVFLLLGFILSLYSINISDVAYIDIIQCILIFIVPLIAIIAILSLMNKNNKKLAGILFIGILLFCIFGYIRNYLYTIGLTYISVFGINLQNQIVLLPLFILIFGISMFIIAKSKNDFSNHILLLNIITFIFVVVTLFNVLVLEVNKTNNKLSSSIGNTSNLPDIYYIVLDEYAREDVIEECYSFDNSYFTEYLEGKGFYVADNSTSNYNTTSLSMPSILNMDYLDSSYIKNANTGWGNNKVSEFLKDKGYKYIYITGNIQIKGMDQDADLFLSYKPKINNFTYGFLETTMAWPIYRVLTSFNGIEGMLPEQYRQSVLYAFDEIIKVPDDTHSTFTYMHVMIPHPPFIFEDDGSPTKSITSSSILQEGLLWQPNNPVSQFEGHEEGYVKQVAFANKKIQSAIDEIMEKSQGKAIIILQGDHGIRIQKERCYDILNAYYFPDNDYSMLYESISPVNSFRVLFNKYFGGNFELLNDNKIVVGE